jgi:hypothetical protein
MQIFLPQRTNNLAMKRKGEESAGAPKRLQVKTYTQGIHAYIQGGWVGGGMEGEDKWGV